MTDMNEAAGADALEPVQGSEEAVGALQPQEKSEVELAPPETGPSDDPKPEPQESDGKDAQPKKKGGFQRQIEKREADISKLTAEKYEAELRARRAEELLQAERRKNAPAELTDPGVQPQVENFATLEEYYKAVGEWSRTSAEYAAQEALKKAETERKQQEEQARAAQAAEALGAKLAVSRQRYVDFDQTIAPIAPMVDANPAILDVLHASEIPGEIAYHLAKNPAVLFQLLNQTPAAIYRELFAIEERLKAPPPPKPVTSAPEPIKPVGSRAPVAKTIGEIAEADDATAYIQKMNALRKR